jgi:hypothetical protein
MARHADPSNERRWLELIRRWQQSGLGVRDFCKRQRLREANFFTWRRVLRQRGVLDELPPADGPRAATPPVFVKVAVDAGPAAIPAIDLVLASGRLLRVHPGFDPDLLRQLLRLLEEPSC